MKAAKSSLIVNVTRTNIIIASAPVAVAQIIILSTIAPFENFFLKLLKYYCIFYIIGTTNSQLNSKLITSTYALSPHHFHITSTAMTFQENFMKSPKTKMLDVRWQTDPKTTIIPLINHSMKSELIQLRQLFQRSIETMEDFIIEKDLTDPSTLLNVIVPHHFSRFRQFIAKVVDISTTVDLSERDINRTFLASPSNFKIINIHGLHPGHQYSVSVIGRREGESTLLKEATVITDPVAPNFSSRNASILSSYTNITLRAQKPEKALQDIFRISYVQLEPLRHFPILEVNDIPEQRHIEIYLGNLNPGCDYNVSITPQMKTVEGRPWIGVLTTKPHSPQNLTVAELNVTCVRLSWYLSFQTGADLISVSYRPERINIPMTKLKVPGHQTSVEICEGLKPGRTYLFIVKTEKSSESSEAVKLSHTLKPKIPENLAILIDYGRRKFRLVMNIAPESESHTEQCFVSLVNEKLEVIERISTVDSSSTHTSSTARECSIYVDLQPGHRYEVSAKTMSENASSNTISKSFALQPAFDLKTFGLRLFESDGSLMLTWPKAEMARARLDDIWENIVGTDSTLHLRILPQTKANDGVWQEQSKRFERQRYEREPLIVPKLRRGACYKVQIYTVTKSGIASAEKFEEIIRISAPFVNISAEEITKSTAAFRVTLKASIAFDPPECILHVIVMDKSKMTIYDRTTPLTVQISPIVLEGLRPYHQYTINSQVICGRLNDYSCPPKNRTMEPILFETRQDRPGPIQNLTVRILNPYSVQLLWMPPALPNGIITHYIIGIHPMQEENDEESDWSMSVGAGTRQLLPISLSPSSSSYHDSSTEQQLQQQPMEAVVDNLIGGLRYRMDVRAVTEAGEGDLSAPSDTVHAEMPILPPPRPSSRIEIVFKTIHSTDVGIRYSTSMYNTKHGYLKKSALIVAEVNANNDHILDSFMDDYQNKTFTWGEVQKFDIWPAYIALETVIEPYRKFFPPRTISEIVGVDSTCNDIKYDNICNGPLKPSTSYRFKLRLYTAPNMWTDSEFSEIATTKASSTLFTLTVVAILLLFLIFGITSVVAFIAWKKRTKSCPPIYGNQQQHQQHHYTHSEHFLGVPDRSGSGGGTGGGGGGIGFGLWHPNFSSPRTVTRLHKQKESTTVIGDREVPSHWAILKMMMAERAAQCLAKLGLDAAAAAASPTTTTTSTSTASISTTSQHGTTNQSQSIISTTDSTTIAATTSNDLTTFGHHRRSRSLRERTGVDQRLERLPSGPMIVQKFVPHTVIPGSNIEKSRPVRVEDFAEHVRSMSADSDFRFSEEYEDLKLVGYGQTCIAADLTVNRSKNRFTNILPYDHSRVKLIPADNDDGSDYVNASYIPGFNSRREFIAAQGPLPSTRDHFWRVVWEQHCPAIVALTKCVEKGRDKCHQYWPDNDQLCILYADIEVTLVNEKVYDEFVIRELRLTNMNEPLTTPRIVKHLHYMAWPDFGVPECAAGLVHFVRLFRAHLPPLPNNKPTIVHCSAGVGRSGTFIALDRLMQCVKKNLPLDVFGIVYEMRLDRCHMVQNEQQYIFIHHCLLYVLETEDVTSTNMGSSMSQIGADEGLSVSTFSSDSSDITFPNSILNNDFGNKLCSGIASNDIQVINSNGNITFTGATSQQQHPYATWIITPRIEVHQNPAFDDDDDDDEGIAESV